MESSLIFALDSPQYHLLKKDASNRFSGLVFDYHSKPVKGINVYRDHQFVERFPADSASEDIHHVVPHIAMKMKAPITMPHITAWSL
jgi:hypothetical protein